MSKYDEASIRSEYRRLTKYLIEHNMTITTMESATSGQIASLITDTEGASAIFKGSFVTYSNETKIMCGVPSCIIDEHTVYSVETAEAMARVCIEKLAADIGIGVTGTMGNIDPTNESASVPGRVYFSIIVKDEAHNYSTELVPQESRLMYKLAVAKEIYDRLAELMPELT